MRPEMLAEIKRRSAEQKRRIATGELLVCTYGKPMPSNCDQVGQHWFHEKAVKESVVSKTERIYHCPVCNTRFTVTLKRIEVK